MNFGFVSTRFAGIDGVSLEAAKWAEVLISQGHHCFWFSGLNDRGAEISMCYPEAYFGHPENEWINQRIWQSGSRTPELSRRIEGMVDRLKEELRAFTGKFSIDVLIPENAVTIPMNVPLGLAVTEFLGETKMASIAHHHDFYWERSRFSDSVIDDLLERAFPPVDRKMAHTVINSPAREELARRKGIDSTLIPNVFDFENRPPDPDDYSSDVRESLGLRDDDIFILQPTRIVPRKGIEHTIKLAGILDDPGVKVVISHAAGDEGFEYMEMLRKMADESGVDLRIVADRVGEERGIDAEGRKIFTLWDLYPHCDLVAYPSSYEGFGNALLEAIYFRKPVMINRYPIFVADIEPKGFRLAEMDGEISTETVAEVKRLLFDENYRQEVVDHNYAVALEHYSYTVLRRSFQDLLKYQNISI